jgi:multidrug transporter EmrE-like cation transporter
MRTALFLACYCIFVTAANSLLKLSANAHGVVPFLLYQAGGNLAGLAGILVYTGLMRRMPLHLAFPLSRGAGVLGVQLVASMLIFHEAFRPTEVAAMAVVAAGIIVVGMSAPRQPRAQSRREGGM